MFAYYDNGVCKVNKTEIVDGNISFIHGYITNDEKHPGIVNLYSSTFKGLFFIYLKICALFILYKRDIK